MGEPFSSLDQLALDNHQHAPHTLEGQQREHNEQFRFRLGLMEIGGFFRHGGIIAEADALKVSLAAAVSFGDKLSSAFDVIGKRLLGLRKTFQVTHPPLRP